MNRCHRCQERIPKDEQLCAACFRELWGLNDYPERWVS